MKDFEYYAGDDIQRPQHKKRTDFTSFKASLKSYSGTVVDVVEGVWNHRTIQELSKNGYLVEQTVDEVEYNKYLANEKKENDNYKKALDKRRDDFLSDFSKENKIDVKQALTLMTKAQNVHEIYADFVYDEENFKKQYENHFKLLFEIMETIK